MGSPIRSDNVYLANNEQASLVFFIVHAEHTVEPLLTVTSIHRSPPDKRPEKKVPAELMVKLL